MLLELGTTNVHHKRNKMTQSCYHDNSFAAGAVSIKTENPSFCLNPAPSTAANPMIGIKTIWELCLFQVGPVCLTLEVANGVIWFFFNRKRWKSCYGNSTKGVILFLLWCTFVLQVSRTLVQYFSRYCLFSILPFLVANNMTSSLI